MDNATMTAIVETNYGLIQGVLTLSLLNDVFYSFRGIPYAKKPLGQLRFKVSSNQFLVNKPDNVDTILPSVKLRIKNLSIAQSNNDRFKVDRVSLIIEYNALFVQDPELLESFSGTWDATRESLPCWHRDQFSGDILGSEDCLHLNVYTRAIKPMQLNPVIVYIHGGAFMFGSSSESSTGPDYLMQKNVVLVTLNFRQGAFGFLSLSNDSFNIPGNAGLKDQSFALRWVKENIQNFGGDPNNVLLFGYSSGACAVHYHMLSHWSKDLFHKAIVMSGSVLNTRFDLPESKDFYVERLAAFNGWNRSGSLQNAVDVLSTADPSNIVRAEFQSNFLLFEDQVKGVRFPYGPVIERNFSGFMPTQPRLRARNSWSKHIPVVLSSTSDEALLSRRAAAAKGSNLLSTIDFKELIPRDIGRVLSDVERQSIAGKIRNYYFEDESAPKEQILDDYVRMETDRLYVHGMHRMALSRLRENSNQATFLYRFNAESPTMNHFRILKCGQKCKGVCHGDDLSYIFRNLHVKTIEDIDEHDMRTISNVVDILYNFATSNDPNVDRENFPWLPLNKQDREHNEFKCLNVAQNLSIVDLPEMDRMQLWNSFYDADYLT